MVDVRKEFKIINRLGLHARASAELVKVTNRFSSRVTISKGSMTVDGKSILGIMSLAGVWARRSQHCEGADCKEAIVAIGQLINDYFGEGE